MLPTKGALYIYVGFLSFKDACIITLKHKEALGICIYLSRQNK